MAKDARPPKTVLDKVSVVISGQETPGGSSRPAIVKGMKEKFSEVTGAQLKTALKKGVETGVLVQGQGQRWWVEGHAPPPPPQEETVDIVDIKVRHSETIKKLLFTLGPGGAGLHG